MQETIPDNLPTAVRQQYEASLKLDEMPPESATTQTGSVDPTLQHRFDVLQGKYNAEVPRLSDEIRYLRSENQALRTENEHLKNELAQRSARPAEPEKPSELDETLDELAFEKGEESSEYKALKALREQMRRVSSTVEDAKATAAKTSEKAAETAYLNDLDRLFPQWEALNASPDFWQWANSKTDVSGNTYTDLIAHFNGQRDAQRVAGILGLYKPKQTGKPSDKLGSQVVPSGGVAEFQVDPASGKVWTQQEVNTFTKNLATRQARMTPQELAEAEKILAEIDKAYVEGRVR